MAKKNNTSEKGYKANSPDRNNPYNIIESGRITMQNVPHPVLGVDEFGNQQMMMPEGEYNFPGNNVFELPIRQQGEGLQNGINFNNFEAMNYMNQGGVPMGYHMMPDGTLMSDEQMAYGGYMQNGGGFSIANPNEMAKMNQNQSPFYSTDADFTAMSGRQEREGSLNLPMMQQTMFPINMPDQSGVNIEVMPQNANMEPMLERNQRRFNSILENKEINRMQAATKELGYNGPQYALGGPSPSINQGAIMQAFLQQGGGMKPFKTAVKKYFKGNLASQNQDTDDVLATRKATMESYLSNTAMQAIAMEEADNLMQAANNYMQQGGNFGYNPNLYGRNQYQNQQDSNYILGQRFGDFRQATNTMFQGANPYTQVEYKMQEGGALGSPYLYQPIDPSLDTNAMRINMERVQGFSEGERQGRITPQGEWLPTYPNQPIYSTPSNQESGIQIGNTPYTGRPSSVNIPKRETNTTTPTEVNSGAPRNIVPPNPIAPIYTAPGQENRPVNFQGNYQGNPNAGKGSQLNQPYYVQGQPNYASTGYQPVNGGYGNFPMNANPYVKTKGRGMSSFNSPGFSNILYDPNRITSIDQKKRLFGKGLRKQTINFGPQGQGTGVGAQYPQGTGAVESGYPQEYDTMGNPIGSPDIDREQWIDKNMDPKFASYSKEDDMTPERNAEMNAEYERLNSEYENSRSRQAQNIPNNIPIQNNVGTKFQNFMQERRAEKTRKGKGIRNKKDKSNFETAVHPSLREFGGQHTGRNQYNGGNPLYQQGGGYVNPMDPTQMNTINNTPIVPPINGAFGYGNPDNATGKIVQKFKRGFNPEEGVAWGMAGMNALASIPEAIDARKNEEFMKSRMFGDALFNPMQAGDVSRGDYEVNTGMIRPDDNVPVQFSGNNFGQIGSPVQYEQGGEYDLTDAEIQQIMAMGGTVEYID